MSTVCSISHAGTPSKSPVWLTRSRLIDQIAGACLKSSMPPVASSLAVDHGSRIKHCCIASNRRRYWNCLAPGYEWFVDRPCRIDIRSQIEFCFPKNHSTPTPRTSLTRTNTAETERHQIDLRLGKRWFMMANSFSWRAGMWREDAVMLAAVTRFGLLHPQRQFKADSSRSGFAAQ